LLQDKATLKLNAQDILQTMNFGGKMDFGNLNGVTKFHLNDRAVNLTFTWNFGNQKVQVNKYKKTGIQQEEQRIQKGNSGVGTGTSK
jgi:aminoglycoside phosphotransferase